MPLSLPRGLGPVRLIAIFLILISLLAFRSFLLPSGDGSREFSISTSPSWWGSAPPADDVVDIDFDDDEEEQTLLESPVAQDGDDDSTFISEDTDLDDPFPQNSSGGSYDSGFTSQPAFEPLIPACRQLPGADKVVVMVKTGATEVFSRVPEQIITLAECVPNFMIFSDMEQDVGDFHIYDALDEIGKEYKENHEDFKFYNAIHNAYTSHGDVSVFGSEKAWNLDKWKNIPMLHKAYTKYPDAEWFITIDADTYLGWTNLLLLLDRMDPDEPLYAGCVYWHGPTAFAQGGTGYLLSRNAVEKFENIRNPEKISDWEKETSTICCGDVMLGVAMGHAGVSVSGAWPMFQVDPPSSITWSDRLWCTPAITWHHIHTYEVEALWQFEKDWINRTWDNEDPGSVPYLYRDAFEYFVEAHMSEKKKDWDNYASDKIFTEPKEDHVKENHDWDGKNDEEKKELWDSLSQIQKDAVESAENCYDACKDDVSCMQYSWHPGTCKLHTSLRMGRASDPKEEYISGWMEERVEAFKEARGDCSQVQWNLG